MTTANKLTILRVVMIPAYIILMLLDFPGHKWIALGVFILASLTDFLDGHIARKYNQITTFGKFMDPLADKLLVTAALILFVQWRQVPAWIAIIILAREFGVTALRLVAASDGTVIAAGISGKVKTFSSMVCLCLMMTPWHDLVLIPFGPSTPLIGAALTSSQHSLVQIPAAFTLDWLCNLVMLITTVWSGAEYFVRYGKLLKVK